MWGGLFTSFLLANFLCHLKEKNDPLLHPSPRLSLSLSLSESETQTPLVAAEIIELN